MAAAFSFVNNVNRISARYLPLYLLNFRYLHKICPRNSNLIANKRPKHRLQLVQSQNCVGFRGPHVRLYPKISCRAFSENPTDKDNFSKEEDFEEGDTVHVIRENERIIGETQRHDFQAETRQLLDIVAKTLYSEKEVFIREMISNASDALEKLQYQFLTGKGVLENELPLEINIATDQDKRTLTIQDHGIGMTKEELLDNLGTIARSGSKAFLEELGKLGQGDSQGKSIIGQFGVGFYSSFMVADRVDVFTLKDSYGLPMDIIKKYSNFVGFPIYLDGTCINTIQPLWMLDPNAISSQEHEEFYQFIAKSHDRPRYMLHYKTDAPLNIRSIFYIPETVPQLFTMANTEYGVSLYSRKVLIQSKAQGVLPNWLRFVKGVVDSEDIPLNLSRELLQDSALITKLSQVLQSRIVKFLQQQQKKDRVKFENFFKDCGTFFREGIVSSNNEDEKQDIAKLLLFESSQEKAGELTSLSLYVSRMKQTQQYIYYLCAPSRELAETSPYYEALKKDDVEVLFTYNEQDDVTLHYLSEFHGKKIIAAENYFSVDREVKSSISTDTIDADNTSDSLSDEQAKDLADWISIILGKEKVPVVKVSKHLSKTSHPVMVTVPDMVAAKHWLKVMRAQQHQDIDNTKYHFFQPTLEINPSHELIKQLQEVRSVNLDLAVMVVHQLLDNAMISAGLLDDPRSMVSRLNSLLAQVLDSAHGTAKPE
ncbi:hypothetical protein pdam_00005475 [Pocillopora damicornis]|uniref:Histidine kinase/HSP90-like ATPase domain-containing protein n=1 Tax=Pocillopora damicornis TaxID=46731 RepID=A0A3M6TAH3_POCDA|nr:hypothetical protein pdam_00005475 [Pocillopora damicornis]